MRPTYRPIDTQWKGKAVREKTLLINGFIEAASSRRRLSRHPVDQPSVSMIVGWVFMWFYRVSHCPTFSVNSLWIIGVCYRGMFVSVGQSHDISLWSILSLGNRSINVEMIHKLQVFDINWRLITLIIYVQTLKRLLGELTRGYDTSV